MRKVADTMTEAVVGAVLINLSIVYLSSHILAPELTNC